MKRTVLGLVRFGALGAVTFATNVGLTVFLHEVMRLSEEFAFALSLVTVFSISFVACRYIVFENAWEGDPRNQVFLFLVSSLGFRGIEYVMFLLLHSLLGIYYLVALTTVLIVSFFAKFLYYRRAVFVAAVGGSTAAKAQQYK
jgi:putative flippase GtrA